MKVLMVCLGNICRSPLAEGILKSKLDPTLHQVDSAGTAAYHVGEPPDKRSIAIAAAHGIDISGQRARQFQVEDFELFDRIYVMDHANYQNVLHIAPNEIHKNKVQLLCGQQEVPDPYYGGDKGFAQVFDVIDQACSTLKKSLTDG